MFNKAEYWIEVFLFKSRWFLVPLYLGLLLSLFVLMVKFVQEFLHIVPHVLEQPGTTLILEILGLVDIVLIANLILMIVFSGYESFVSKIDFSRDHTDRPDWMGKVDYSALKLKVIGSVVAISSIELLRAFMQVEKLSDKTMIWMVVIHMAFVVSGLLFALMEKLSHHESTPEEK